MVFEGAYAFGCAVSSYIAYSADGIHDWKVLNALVCTTSWDRSASTPNLFFDPDTGGGYLQWAEVDYGNQTMTRHQAPLVATPWGPIGRITSDPSIGELPQPPTGSWGTYFVGSGNVLAEDGTYYMFTEGANQYGCEKGQPNQWGINFARASAASPSAWQWHPSTPVLMAIYPTNCNIDYPELAKLGDTTYLYYDNPEIDWTPSNVETLFRRTIS